AALDILVSACGNKFTGRRRPGGGYYYFDARQDKQFNIAGPNPTPAEMKKFDEEYSRYLVEQRRLEAIEDEARAEQKNAEERQRWDRYDWELKQQQLAAEREAKQQQLAADLKKRQENAKRKVQITSVKFDCSFIGRENCELSFDLTIDIKN